ncbi:MAG: WD40/YVTN/BNR-like repeat-containing protein, partial [Planctomycetota bacterium]
MARRRTLPPLAVILTSLSCASGHLAEPSGLSAPVTATFLRACEGEAQLCLDDIVSLPGDIVFLGGHFLGAGGPLCSALFVSRDGGRTWRDAGLRYGSCGIQDLRTVGTSNVRGIVTFRQEGCHDPERVIRSDDAGRTWSVTPLEPGLTGLAWVSRFEFDDAEHGLLSVSGGIRQTKTFSTEDGGRTWRLLWSARRSVEPEVEEGADHPPSPRRPPSAPL